MEAQPVPDPSVMEALARSGVYRFLSLAFLPGDGAPGAAARPAGETAALRDEYHRIFGHQISQDCPLYETQYLGGQVFQQAQQLADIAGFYLAFGLEVAEETPERADHISLELEFMQALALREAYARAHHGPAEVDLLRDAQRAFLRDHLTRWVPVFARLVGRKTDGLYALLADLAAAWVSADAAALGLPPAGEIEYLPPASPDQQESTPPCGAERCVLDPA